MKMKKETTIKVISLLSYINIIFFIGAFVTALVSGIFTAFLPLVLILFCSMVITRIILNSMKNQENN